MDFEDVLFRRTLVKALRNQPDEDDNRSPEELVVTKERNGYALWFRGEGAWPMPKILAWAYAGGRDDIIALAVKMTLAYVRHAIEDGSVIFKVDRLEDLAMEPLPEKKAP